MLIIILLLIIIFLIPSPSNNREGEDWDKDYRIPIETNKRKKIIRRVVKQGDVTLGEEITEEYNE